MKILALDISTKTGWAVISLVGPNLNIDKCGQFKPVKKPLAPYPVNMVDWAQLIFDSLKKLVDENKPDVVVIEETSKSKRAMDQKILEFIHFLVASMIKQDKLDSAYLMTGEWRKLTGCHMTEEEKKRNEYVREYKKKFKQEVIIDKKGKKKKKAIVVYDTEGKRIGLVNKKHVAIRRANAVFGKMLKRELKKKDEDLADALMIGYAYLVKTQGVQNV